MWESSELGNGVLGASGTVLRHEEAHSTLVSGAGSHGPMSIELTLWINERLARTDSSSKIHIEQAMSLAFVGNLSLALSSLHCSSALQQQPAHSLATGSCTFRSSVALLAFIVFVLHSAAPTHAIPRSIAVPTLSIPSSMPIVLRMTSRMELPATLCS